jgi:hypothetical protein
MTSLHLLFRNGDEDDRVRVKLAVGSGTVLGVVVYISGPRTGSPCTDKINLSCGVVCGAGTLRLSP